MYSDLAGQTALITGAGQGIGREIAIRFGAEGMKVSLFDICDSQLLEQTAELVREAGGQAVKFSGNVLSEEDVQMAVRGTVSRFGSLDVLVNNAGIESTAPSHELPLSEWNQIVGVNQTGVFLFAREAIRIMLKQGSGGSIINVSSVHQKIPKPRHVHYASSKGGVAMLTESLAAEYAHAGIRVNAIAPGAIRTQMNETLLADPGMKKKIENLIPMRKIGRTANVAACAAWLASNEADYVTGISLFVDGGMSLYPTYIAGDDAL
ncbi:glucose 1-dehydrogenase [Paenibacillus sp. MMO-177]|uniref:glucose 1-dehydrogenase n=1 Tax=Paenibacillus sp. MMO-177 TaxID=3081289 RepID=UPI0030159A07